MNLTKSLPTRMTLLAVASVILVQILLVSVTFPVSALWSDVPLFNIDTPFHWYNMFVARALGEQGLLVGYDPFFGAGHAGGLNINVSARVPALIVAFVFPGASIELVQKCFWLLTAILAPACAPWAAAILRAGRIGIAAAAFLGVAMWWATASHWYYTAGMVSYVLVCYASLPFAAAVIGTVENRQWTFWRVMGMALAAAGLGWLHSLFPVIAACLVAPCLIANWRSLVNGRALLSLTGIAAITLALNLPWLLSLQSTIANIVGTQPYQQAVDFRIALHELLGLWRGHAQGAKLYPALAALCLVTAFIDADTSRRRLARYALVSWAMLVIFAAFGAAIPALRALQPNRFALAAYVSLLPAAAVGVATLTRFLRDAAAAPLWLRAAIGMTIGAPLAFATVEIGREVSRAPIGHYGSPPPLVRGVGATSRELISWLRQHTSADGRVLFETSLGRVHDGAHMAGYYAIQSDREFIGGPYPFMFEAGAWDGVAFGQPVEKLAVDEFRRYLDAYNVGWIVAHSGAMRSYLEKFPDIIQQATIKNIAMYVVRRPLGYFASGAGRVIDRGINRLQLDQLEGGNIRLKYHYVPGLRATNGANITPCKVPGIAQPFICLSGFTTGSVEVSLR